MEDWFENTEERVARWQRHSAKDSFLGRLPASQASVLAEALQLATLTESCWCARDGRPGLQEVESATGLGLHLAAELRDLHDCILRVQTKLALWRAAPAPATAPAERAQVLVRELTGALQLLADTGHHPQLGTQLHQVRKKLGDTRSQDALAQQLVTWAMLAQQHRMAFCTLPGMSETLLDEAQAVAQAVRVTASAERTGESAERELERTKTHLFALLQERIQAVKRAFRWLFREHPALLALVSDAPRARRRESASATDGVTPS